MDFSDDACELIYEITDTDVTIECGCGDVSSLIEAFGVDAMSHEWDGGLPGHNGDYYFFTVRRELQAELLEKLKVMKDRLKEFVLASMLEKYEELESPIKEQRSKY